MRGLIEDLHDIGKDAAWKTIEALAQYYEIGTLPADLSGEARLTVAGIIGKAKI